MITDAETAAVLALAGDPEMPEALKQLAIIKPDRLGWGLPEPFDAYSDGSVNPVDTIYTYTTALAGLALLRTGHKGWALVAADTLKRLTAPSGWLWYSDQEQDQQDGYEVPNVTGLAIALLARLGQPVRQYAGLLTRTQGTGLDMEHDDWHPWNWRYRIGLPQPTDLFHETLIAYGLWTCGERQAATSSIDGMWALHFDDDRHPLERHREPGRPSWGPAAMAWLTGDPGLARWLEDNPAAEAEDRDGHVAAAWRTLALATTGVAA